MKIRQGFVSNSSSSSFIISTKGRFKTVRDVGSFMIKTQSDDYKEDKKWIENLKRVDPDMPITFPSCNYDTAIVKIGEQILISTCNNTDWKLDNDTERLLDKTKKELKIIAESRPVGSEDRDCIEEMIQYPGELYVEYLFDNFHSPVFDIVGKEVDFDYDKSYCKNKNSHKRLMQWDYDCHLWKTRLGVLCPICDGHKLKRKEKLEKIKSKIKK